MDVQHGLVHAELVEKFLQPLMCCWKVIIFCALRAHGFARVKRLVALRVGAIEAVQDLVSARPGDAPSRLAAPVS